MTTDNPQIGVAQGIAKAGRLTPLAIILAFVLLTEVAVVIGVLGTAGVVQLILALFCALFPVIVAASFFFILVKSPWVLYAPGDYSGAVDPTTYIDAVSRSSDGSKRLDAFVKQLPQLVSEIIKQKPDLKIGQPGGGGQEADLVDNFSEQLVEQIEKRVFIVLDLKEFGGDTYRYLPSKESKVADLLDDLYFKIRETADIPSFSYNKVWVLQDLHSDKVYDEIGTAWARARGDDRDYRSLASVGIMPGDSLRVRKLDLRDTRSRSRPSYFGRG